MKGLVRCYTRCGVANCSLLFIAFLLHDFRQRYLKTSRSRNEMTSNRTDRRQANDGLPYKPSKTNHGKTLADSLDIVRKQEDIMAHVLRDLEFFRKKFKTSLEYDSAAGNYDEEWGDGTLYDCRSDTDAGNGIIKEETMVNYIGYRIAMDNFQMGFDKTKDQIKEIWEAFEGGKGPLALQQYEMDGLEKGRRVAIQE